MLEEPDGPLAVEPRQMARSEHGDAAPEVLQLVRCEVIIHARRVKASIRSSLWGVRQPQIPMAAKLRVKMLKKNLAGCIDARRIFGMWILSGLHTSLEKSWVRIGAFEITDPSTTTPKGFTMRADIAPAVLQVLDEQEATVAEG